MASVLVVSRHGDGVPLALRLAQEKHIVKVFIEEEKAKGSLKGFKNPSIIGSLRMLEQYDLVLFDMVGMGNRADEIKEEGRLVMGGGKFNDKLELERDYGERVASLTKVKIPKTFEAESPQECLKYLESSGKAQVIKPLGNQPPGLTLVSKDERNRTLISLVKGGKLGKDVTPCLIQERVDGVEVSTEGWFNGENFVDCFNHTIEYKRFMEGDKGCQTGCMGNIVWMTKAEKDELVKRALLPLEPLLTKVGYLGPIDVNCMVTEKDAYFLEYTARFGYDAIQALCELTKDSLFNFLWKIASREDSMHFLDDYAIAVRLSMPPYPGEDGVEILKGAYVLDVPNEARKHLMFSDVMLKDGGEVVAGVDGVLGCATARGSSIQEARRRVYRTVENIVIHDDVQYRKDIGAGVEGSIEKLKTWGWVDV
jgi:phosphoribosylamine--glycine ligase